MVPSGRTVCSSLVTNDASAWYLTVGLACGRHLRRIRWRAAAGGSNVYALGASCNSRRISLRCRTGLAAVMRRSSQASGGHTGASVGGARGLLSPGTSAGAATKPLPPTLSDWAIGLSAGVRSHTSGSSSQLYCSRGSSGTAGTVS